MSNESSAIVQRVWNYAHTLRADGISYGDYVEQITYLLFLKLAKEMEDLGDDPPSLRYGEAGNPISEDYQWTELA